MRALRSAAAFRVHFLLSPCHRAGSCRVHCRPSGRFFAAHICSFATAGHVDICLRVGERLNGRRLSTCLLVVAHAVTTRIRLDAFACHSMRLVTLCAVDGHNSRCFRIRCCASRMFAALLSLHAHTHATHNALTAFPHLTASPCLSHLITRNARRAGDALARRLGTLAACYAASPSAFLYCLSRAWCTS